LDPIFIFFLVMLVFLYLLLIRPQRQQAKRHQEMLHHLQVGDEVITAGGIYGEVTQLDEDRVQLEIDADVRIAVSRKAIANKVPPEEAPAEAEEPAAAEEPAGAAEAVEAEEPETPPEPEPVAEDKARR
jgi:preprotein translocase subunit YajC